MSKYIVELPISISYEDQQTIIDETLEWGATSFEYNAIPVWKSVVFTNMFRDDNFVEEPQYPFRLDDRVTFEFRNMLRCNKSSMIIQELLSQIPLYKVTRVLVLLQEPNIKLGEHRDLVPGHLYDNMEDKTSVLYGDKTLRYEGTYHKAFQSLGLEIKDTEVHAAQSYMSLKIPLSVMPGNPGLPFILNDGVKTHFNTHDKLYLLNEYECEHGADAVDFWRGVIFVDGFFNLDVLNQMLDA